VSDLASLRAPPPPFDIASLTVPAVYVYGDVLGPDFYRSLSAELASINPLIRSRQVVNAAHGAHLSIPDQLGALIGELWDGVCASA
jgi:pimeloyl-ACP methyl ester carboxylesterase